MKEDLVQFKVNLSNIQIFSWKYCLLSQEVSITPVLLNEKRSNILDTLLLIFI